jgi:hypothetical protein
MCALTPAVLTAGDDADFNRDLLHTVAARRALLQDKELGPLNLGVKVENRVATLWGSIPSRELAKRAADLLQKMPELIGVRDDMQIEPSLTRPMFLPETSPERLRLPPLPVPLPPGILTNHPLNSAAAAIATNQTAWQPVQRNDPRMPDDRDIDVVMSALPVPTPIPEAANNKPLAQALGDLQRDKRFNRIRVEVNGDTVYLRGDPQQPQNIYELARLISQLADVRRVIVKDN